MAKLAVGILLGVSIGVAGYIGFLKLQPSYEDISYEITTESIIKNFSGRNGLVDYDAVFSAKELEKCVISFTAEKYISQAKTSQRYVVDFSQLDPSKTEISGPSIFVYALNDRQVISFEVMGRTWPQNDYMIEKGMAFLTGEDSSWLEMRSKKNAVNHLIKICGGVEVNF